MRTRARFASCDLDGVHGVRLKGHTIVGLERADLHIVAKLNKALDEVRRGSTAHGPGRLRTGAEEPGGACSSARRTWPTGRASA
ncbi:MAG: hypothetical protein EXR87_07090 [Gammaproteobacteria bacterium]|nr:hypothetical protein [Gammaproteobacteria bacterium]